MIYPRRLSHDVTMRRFLRPCISESLPKRSPHRNIPIEYIPCEYGFQCSATEKFLMISGSIGMSIPIPSISRNAVERIRKSCDFFCMKKRKCNDYMRRRNSDFSCSVLFGKLPNTWNFVDFSPTNPHLPIFQISPMKNPMIGPGPHAVANTLVIFHVSNLIGLPHSYLKAKPLVKFLSQKFFITAGQSIHHTGNIHTSSSASMILA